MKRNRLLLGAFSALTVLASAALAREPGVLPVVPPGNTLGAPVAAQLPPGFYLSSRTGTGSLDATDANGNKTGTSITVTDTALQLIAVPGAQLFGGQYRAVLTFPVSRVNVDDAPTPFGLVSGDSTGIPSVDFRPIDISWQIQPGIFASAGLSIHSPGKWSATNVANNGGNFWTYGAHLGVSYLRDGWNLTGHLAYYTSGSNRDNGYQSGDEINLNITAMKAIGDSGWSVGPVAYARQQVSDDKNPNGAYGGLVAGRARQGGLGLSATKRFGPVEFNAIYTQDLYSKNAAEGGRLWINLTVPLGGPKR
jgi:hypothetical protein